MNKSEECPTKEYTPGEPSGKCWGNGHYQCNNCICYRKDFHKNGQEYIDFAHNLQGGIQFHTLK